MAKKDITGAVAAAVRGLHLGDNDSMEDALREILGELSPTMADLFDENPEEAYSKTALGTGQDEISSDDEDYDSDYQPKGYEDL